jgi:hypothetical protein
MNQLAIENLDIGMTRIIPDRMHDPVQAVSGSLKPLEEAVVAIDHQAGNRFTPIPGLRGKGQFVELSRRQNSRSAAAVNHG